MSINTAKFDRGLKYFKGLGPQTKAQQKGIIKNTELIGEVLGSSLTEDEVQELLQQTDTIGKAVSNLKEYLEDSEGDPAQARRASLVEEALQILEVGEVVFELHEELRELEDLPQEQLEEKISVFSKNIKKFNQLTKKQAHRIQINSFDKAITKTEGRLPNMNTFAQKIISESLHKLQLANRPPLTPEQREALTKKLIAHYKQSGEGLAEKNTFRVGAIVRPKQDEIILELLSIDDLEAIRLDSIDAYAYAEVLLDIWGEEPLFTDEQKIACIKSLSGKTSPRLKAIIAELKPLDRESLYSLLNFLNELVSCGAQNGMNSTILGTVWAPKLFPPCQDAEELEGICLVTTYFIDQINEVF